MATNKISLIGAEMVTGLIIIMPSANKTQEITRSTTMNGKYRYLGDPIRIQQIILNLVSNAIKFTDHGKVNIQIETIVDERGECLSIRIIDTGIGITYAQQQEIFMPFVQADASIARRYGGTGLGLSLCSKLCELMNGSIAVRSASKLDGHSHSGSEFKVTLPLAISREVTKLIEPVPDQDATPLVFLCDDPDWESAITPYLHRWGFSVTHTLSVDQIQRQDSLILMLDDKNAWNQVKKRYGGPIIQLTDTSTRQVEATDKRTFVSRYWLWGIKTALSCVVAPLLPMTNAKSQDQPATDAAPPRAINVLVLEDHPVNLELINDQLQDLGYDAKLADNAGGAFELYNQFHFDLILTDLNLGGMDGYTFAKILRDLGAKQPIIAITANVSDEERRLCKEAGINDVLMKPVLLKDIRAVVEHYLNVKPSLGTDTAGETPANRFPPDLLLVLKNTTIESFKKIDALQKANNIPPLLAELHSVKGAFGMIGKKWVVELCAEAERTIKAAPLLDHHADLKRLEHEIMVHMDWVL